MKEKTIASLRKNVREKLTSLSKSLHTDVDNIHKLIKEEDGKLIKKFTALIDFAQLGYPIRVMMVMAVSSKEKARIASFLRKHQNVNSLFLINNGYDFFIEMIFKSIKDVHNFTENIESKYTIYDKKEYYILDALFEENFMSNPRLIPC